MPIKSYLAHPYEGEKENLKKELETINECEIITAENKNILIVITDTDNDINDKKLKESIESLQSLKLLALVSGFNTPIK
ncbi:conserved hypothetical protein [Tenacibaculum dicentrarchi]|uniref:Periplasmic nitrate reductase chaperone NapD n=1 Tax=Tenacibaculum dicentrarchi TaxID=669041 RepID=A0ABM9NWX0_9FLAO|nr:conserved hypothetical protein [Tenacibaculum dicentrarchi]